MKNIVIDTCVIIHIVRDTTTGRKCIEALQKFDEAPNIIISVVTKAELQSFILQNNWGKQKVERLNKILGEITCVDINNSDKMLLKAYSEVDAFSKRKTMDKNGKLLVGAARKMGKNDLWIAATAFALDVPIMTSDGDFDHLNGVFLNVIKIV